MKSYSSKRACANECVVLLSLRVFFFSIVLNFASITTRCKMSLSFFLFLSSSLSLSLSLSPLSLSLFSHSFLAHRLQGERCFTLAFAHQLAPRVRSRPRVLSTRSPSSFQTAASTLPLSSSLNRVRVVPETPSVGTTRECPRD